MPMQIEKVKEMLLREKENKGLLITDHLFREVTAVSDRLYILVDGKTFLTRSGQDIETLGYARGQGSEYLILLRALQMGRFGYIHCINHCR